MLKSLYIVILCVFPASTSADCNHPAFSHEIEGKKKPWSHERFYDKNDTFQFAIVSDRTGGERKGVFPEAARKLNLLRPEFVMSVGDLIEGYTEDKESLEQQWDEFDEYVKLFDMPFFYLPGNHDITNEAMDEMWQDRYGQSYYYFTYKNVLFLCLDTQQTENYVVGKPGRHISKKQVAWAKEVLNKYTDVQWTCVFMHQPLWIYNQSKETGFRELEEVLANRDYSVFAGHLHRYVKYDRNNQKYYLLATTGGGSKLRRTDLGEFDHVVWVTMTSEGPVIANLLLDGIHDENIRTEEMKIGQQREAYLLRSIIMTPEDGESKFSIRFNNPYEDDLKYELVWQEGDDWEITPGKAAGVLKGKKGKKIFFTLTKNDIENEFVKDPECLVKLKSSKVNRTIKISGKGITRQLFAPEYKAVEAEAAPVIEGKLDDEIWQSIEPISKFRANANINDISAKTEAYVAYDKDNLYVAIKSFEPNPQKLVAEIKKHDGDVWRDDSVELFLDTNQDKKTYYHLIINSAGTIYDGIGESKNYDIGAQVATAWDSDGWVAEIAIPWGRLQTDAAKSDDKWGVAFVRTRLQAGEKQQMPFLYGGNHQPEMFGTLKFVK